MSCSRHCAMFKATDGKWYLELGTHEYHYDEEREPFQRFGPFDSQDGADRELYRHSNPGALTIDDSGESAPPPAEALTRPPYPRWLR